MIQFKRWHSVVVAALILVAGFGFLLMLSPERDQRLILALMASGVALGSAVWILLDSYLGRISLAAEGVDKSVKALQTKVKTVSERLTEIEQIPPIRKYLETQAAKKERERIGGMDTPQPGDPVMPTFDPEPFTRSPSR